MSPFDEQGKYVRIPQPLKDSEKDIVLDFRLKMKPKHYMLLSLIVIMVIILTVSL